MNSATGRSRGLRARASGAGVPVAALAGAAWLLAACGSPSPGATGSPALHRALAYAQCMRTHGEPDWPDPASNGAFSAGQIDLNAPAFATASNACQQLAGSASFQLSEAQEQQILNAALRAARCMRAHGITAYPDPGLQDIEANAANIGWRTSLAGTGITRAEVESPFFQAASKACGMGGGSS